MYCRTIATVRKIIIINDISDCEIKSDIQYWIGQIHEIRNKK
jgi:hypothetical protein